VSAGPGTHRPASGSPAFFKEIDMSDLIKNFLVEEDGVTAIEYGLIAALIAVTIIATVTTVGDNLVAVFTRVATELSAAL
jgi:pilus assembly protein Flp/PilA